MRKQTARICLTVAVLPTTAAALQGLHNAPDRGNHLALAVAAVSHYPGGAKSTSPSGEARSLHSGAPRPSPGAPGPNTTAIDRVGSELVAASAEALSQGRQIRDARIEAAINAANRRSNAPQPRAVEAVATVYAPPTTEGYSVSVSQSVESVLACIRQYESGGNYADTSNPYYRGAYQFSWSTWQAVGGSGDPAAASPAEQDARAAQLAERDGWGAWSTASMCGV